MHLLLTRFAHLLERCVDSNAVQNIIELIGTRGKTMNRRDFIKNASLVPAAAALGGVAQFMPSAYGAQSQWRVFEVTTRVEV